MTDATVEQQGESKRRREHLEVHQAADSSSSSSSSSSSESSTDTGVGLVDVCTILCDNSEVSKRDKVTEKHVAIAEGREGGPTTLDLTKWDFNKADCRKMVEKSKPLLLIGSPIDSGQENKVRARGVLHLAFICELYETQVREGRYFLRTHSHCAEPAVVDFMNRFPDTFQTVTDRRLYGPNAPHAVNLALICELYETQLHGGRYFLHAHSHSADSWEQSTVVDLMNRFPDTFQTVTDRGLFGMDTLTRWFTNSGCIAQALIRHRETCGNWSKRL